MKRFEIWATFENGMTAKVETHKRMKSAELAVDAMNCKTLTMLLMVTDSLTESPPTPSRQSLSNHHSCGEVEILPHIIERRTT